MHAAAAESGSLADCIEARDGLPGWINHLALQVGLDTTEALAADDKFTNRDQRQCLGVVDRLEFANSHPIAPIFSQGCDAAQLLIVHQVRTAQNRRIIARD